MSREKWHAKASRYVWVPLYRFGYHLTNSFPKFVDKKRHILTSGVQKLCWEWTVFTEFQHVYHTIAVLRLGNYTVMALNYGCGGLQKETPTRGLDGPHGGRKRRSSSGSISVTVLIGVHPPQGHRHFNFIISPLCLNLSHDRASIWKLVGQRSIS